MKTTKVVIDTNVFVSGIFFKGPPYRILKAWQEGAFKVAVSEEIINEYKRVIEVLSAKISHIDFESIMEMLLIDLEIVPSYFLERSVCDDPDDDKFLACAIASRSKYIISGDKHLLQIGTFLDIAIVTPRYFVDKFL